MAFLMLLHEKMRLQRKVNLLTYKQLRASSRKERVTKQIERIQKLYSKRQTRLQNQAKIYQNQFKTQLYNSMGLGTMGQMFNPMFGGITSFVAQGIGQLLSNCPGIADGKKSDGSINYRDIAGGMDESTYQELMGEYSAGTLKANEKGEDGKVTYGSSGQFTEDQYKVFMQALSGANNMQSQAQMYCQNMETQYQTNISIWLEQQEAQLEMEQDEALLPLQEQETEWDLEATSAETQLADARARLDGIKQALSEGIKDSAPTFGLG